MIHASLYIHVVKMTCMNTDSSCGAKKMYEMKGKCEPQNCFNLLTKGSII